MCVAETWLNHNFCDREYFDSRYEVFRCDRNKSSSGYERGGGVLIAARRELCSHNLMDMRAPAPAEEVWISIPLRAGTVSHSNTTPQYLHIILTYIAHGHNHESLLTSFYNRVNEFINTKPNDIFLVVGDFNVSNAHWYLVESLNTLDIQTNNDVLSSLTADFMNMSLLSQYNCQYNINNRLLDLVFCSENCLVTSCKHPIVPEDPHHKSLELDLNLNYTTPMKVAPATRKRQFYKADFDSLKASLRSVKWEQILTAMRDVESMTSNFYEIINNLICKYVPSCNLNDTQHYPPWYTKPLIKLSREKCKYHKKWKRYDNSSDYRTFSMLRKRLKILEQKTYKNYISFSENKITENPKYFWSFVKSKNSNSVIPERMIYKGESITNGNEVCEAFNNYFNSVFISPQDTITKDPPLNSSETTVEMSSININYDSVFKELKHVNIHKGAGSDEIHPIFISICAKELALPILLIFRASIESGIFPAIWKRSLITPIPKNTMRDHITEYRPISKLCVFGKILEKIVTSQMSFAYRNYISEQQHGFFKKRSVDTNMMTFAEHLSQALDDNSQVDVVYTDFSRAFDKINHDLLIKKLTRAGVHGNLLRWIKSYITNRSQAVCVKGYCSRFLPVPSGVPQGSHIAPLLFTLYVNDIGYCLKHCNHLLYADDSKLFKVIKSSNDCIQLQEDLESLHKYCESNQLFLNINKCNIITYTRKTRIIDYEYKLKDKSVKRVKNIRDLGIIMDSKLSFNFHIDHILSSAFRKLGFILRISKPFNKISVLKILYFAFVRSILDFGSVVWNPYFQVQINRIERLQKTFVKSLNYRRNIKNVSYETSLKEYNLLSLQNRRKMFDLVSLYKILNNEIDSSELLGRIRFISRVRLPMRSSRKRPLFVPPPFTKLYTRNSFIYRSTNMYNETFSNIDLFDTTLSKYKKKLALQIVNDI